MWFNFVFFIVTQNVVSMLITYIVSFNSAHWITSNQKFCNINYKSQYFCWAKWVSAIKFCYSLKIVTNHTSHQNHIENQKNKFKIKERERKKSIDHIFIAGKICRCWYSCSCKWWWTCITNLCYSSSHLKGFGRILSKMWVKLF